MVIWLKKKENTQKKNEELFTFHTYDTLLSSLLFSIFFTYDALLSTHARGSLHPKTFDSLQRLPFMYGFLMYISKEIHINNVDERVCRYQLMCGIVESLLKQTGGFVGGRGI